MNLLKNGNKLYSKGIDLFSGEWCVSFGEQFTKIFFIPLHDDIRHYFWIGRIQHCLFRFKVNLLAICDCKVAPVNNFWNLSSQISIFIERLTLHLSLYMCGDLCLKFSCALLYFDYQRRWYFLLNVSDQIYFPTQVFVQ